MKHFKNHSKQSSLYTWLLYWTKVEKQIRKINRDIEKSEWRQINIARRTGRSRMLVNNVLKMRSRCRPVEVCIEQVTGERYDWDLKHGFYHDLVDIVYNKCTRSKH